MNKSRNNMFVPRIKKRNLTSSLENYKKQHKDRAEKMGVLKAFLSALTLTKARKIVFPK